MTLIITAATRDIAIQVADTRLTSTNGKLVDENLVKTTIVHCLDAKLCISYTGLAYINRVRTDIWLAKMLNHHQSWKLSFPKVVQLILETLNETVKTNIHLEKCGLTVVIAGLGLNANKRDLAVAQITNSQKLVKNGIREEFIDILSERNIFRRYFFNPGKKFKWFIEINGAINEKLKVKPFIRVISKKLLKASSQEHSVELVKIIVATLREHRKDGDLSQVIGENCTAVIIGRDFKSYSTFFSKNGSNNRFPNIVSESKLSLDST